MNLKPWTVLWLSFTRSSARNGGGNCTRFAPPRRARTPALDKAPGSFGVLGKIIAGRGDDCR